MKGVDERIEKLRAKFESDLWSDNDCTFNGRIFRIENSNGIIPMSFKYPYDYEDVLTDDRIDGLCFFDVQPNESYSSQYTSNIWICFVVDLKRLYPTITTERATEYAHEDVLKLIKKVWGTRSITGLVRGLSAFSEYTGVKFTDNDQPFYIFRFETEIKYPINC